MTEGNPTPAPSAAYSAHLGGPLHGREPGLWHRPWFPVTLAAALVGLALVGLHVPGVLLYPERLPPPAVVPLPDTSADAERLTQLQEQNRQLRRQVEALGRLAARSDCPPGGEPSQQRLPAAK